MFSEYSFPESHAASFAMLAYASSWLKCHEPEAFLAALLNSQPMGFYSPSQLVQDARRHGEEVRPVDVGASHWEATLEVAGGMPEPGLLKPAAIMEKTLEFAPPSEGQILVPDYAALGLTLGRHPLALLRPMLHKRRFLPADILATLANGQFARACGIVTLRQRPETAKGVMFMSLEDETGTVNVVVWPSLAQKQRQEVLGASLLGVYGIWQCENNVRNLVAKRFVDLSSWLGRLMTSSRDFA